MSVHFIDHFHLFREWKVKLGNFFIHISMLSNYFAKMQFCNTIFKFIYRMINGVHNNIVIPWIKIVSHHRETKNYILPKFK